MRDTKNSDALQSENAIHPTFGDKDLIVTSNPSVPPRVNYEVPVNLVPHPYVYSNQNYSLNSNHPPSSYNSAFNATPFHLNSNAYFPNQGSYGHVSSSADIRWSEHADSVVRPIFDNIGCFVNALSSLSSLLDSTFSSIIQTFQTITSLADSFNNIKDLFEKIWSYLAVFRTLRLMRKKLLIWLKLRPKSKLSSEFDSAWSQATYGTIQNNASIPVLKKKDIIVQFSVLAYFSFVLFGPVLISKFFRSFKPKTSCDLAVVLHDFHPRQSDELKICKGQQVEIAPRIVQEKKRTLNTGWVFVRSGNNYGMVPLNHLEIKM